MNDIDPAESNEWLEAINSVIKAEGIERAQFLLEQVIEEALANVSIYQLVFTLDIVTLFHYPRKTHILVI